MAHVIDLTSDSSPGPSRKNTKSMMPRAIPAATRNPFEPILNNASPGQSSIPKAGLSAELNEAIKISRVERLQSILKMVCRDSESARALVEKEMLVPEHHIVPYDEDTASEEEGIDSEEEDSESDNEEQKLLEIEERVKAMPAGGLKYRPRFVICENCEEEFDVTKNKRGDCVWHTGKKEADFEGDFWADHDENCHGVIEDLVDEPDVQDGFVWTCCHKPGDAEGCRQTKHKMKNHPRKKAETEVPGEAASVSETKRKREDGIDDPNRRYQCAKCPEEFTFAENEEGDCTWHTGTKKVNSNSETWYKYNAGYGPKKLKVDDPDYAGGFTWTCCKNPGDYGGCKEGKHEREEQANKKARS